MNDPRQGILAAKASPRTPRHRAHSRLGLTCTAAGLAACTLGACGAPSAASPSDGSTGVLLDAGSCPASQPLPEPPMGVAVMRFYDSSGNVMYDRGPMVDGRDWTSFQPQCWPNGQAGQPDAGVPDVYTCQFFDEPGVDTISGDQPTIMVIPTDDPSFHQTLPDGLTGGVPGTFSTPTIAAHVVLSYVTPGWDLPPTTYQYPVLTGGSLTIQYAPPTLNGFFFVDGSAFSCSTATGNAYAVRFNHVTMHREYW